MYNNILQILHDYLISQNTDYAILLNGKWGTGKTYFIRHKFLNYLKTYKRDYIYVSLNGLEDAQKIINRVFYKKIMNHRFNKMRFNSLKDKRDGESQKSITASLVDLILEINMPVLKFFKVSQRHIFSKKVFSFENTIIIFDDLERISPLLNIAEVLGQIFDNFIDKGIKTVVIGDVTKLVDQGLFNKVREKIFRQTVYFAPEFDKLFWNFMINRYEKT
ncbi:MAG: P-loop NTPase fold protein, partial [Candidatus Cloacimonetes bacterium]|nr:P-loop NTPase fold protein [Candidatus Cloacimonadota bacterium]